MRTSILASLSLLASALAVPANQGHAHGARHHRHAKRATEIVVVYETFTVDENGSAIGTAQATTTQHVTVTAEATPTAASDAKLAEVPVVVAPVSSSVSEPETTSSTSTAAVSETPVVVIPSSSAQTSTTVTPANVQAASSSSANVGSLALQAGSVSNPLALGVDPSVPFVDGKYDCGTFPASEQGILDLSYLGHGGYTGIQTSDGASDLCDCEGCLCSYACQPGMLKTQWPVDQPANGESRGGLLCQNGKLVRSDTSKNYLCQWSKLTAVAQNTLSQGVAICQTDYPGSENMVIPTYLQPGASNNLAVVDEANYYQWQGKPTSSQFYLNNQGVSQEDGCLWGTPGSNVGNYSPLNLGAGYVDGLTYMSLIKNPNTDTVLNFNIKFYAEAGSTLNGDCKYVNGVYLDSSNNPLPTQDGCTMTCTGTCGWQFY